MTKDYGDRSGRRSRAVERIGAACGVLIALATIPLALEAQRQMGVAKVRAWTLPGPPCPEVSRQAYLAFGTPASNTFTYEGARFARAYGYSNCGRVADDSLLGLGSFPVCQFNNPTVVEVTTARGEFFFMTRAQPATIVLAHGQPRCVLGARLRLDWMRP